LKRVHGPHYERGLRTDHDQVHALVEGRVHDPVEVVGGEVEQRRIFRYSGVPGGAEKLRSARGASQRLYERVLAPAAAQYEHTRPAGGALRSRQ
jgi:hypothetical protein